MKEETAKFEEFLASSSTPLESFSVRLGGTLVHLFHLYIEFCRFGGEKVVFEHAVFLDIIWRRVVPFGIVPGHAGVIQSKCVVARQSVLSRRNCDLSCFVCSGSRRSSRP